MKRSIARILAAFIAAALVGVACGRREGTSALYVLEELEAASSVKDSLDRAARLRIFIDNHRDHPYRSVAYERLLETVFETLADEAGGMRCVRGYLARETDPAARGSLQLAKFRYLLEHDRPSAIALIDTLGATERSPRLFMMIGYHLMDSAGDADAAFRAFMRAADLSGGPRGASQALAMAGAVLERQGRIDEAKKHLEPLVSAGNPEADRLLAGIYWEEGRSGEAIERYIACVANMPGARRRVKLDSLYALVRPDAKDLDELIAAKRVGDAGPMPPGSFIDLGGRKHDLSNLRGTKLVIYALSPT